MDTLKYNEGVQSGLSVLFCSFMSHIRLDIFQVVDILHTEERGQVYFSSQFTGEQATT